MTKLDWCGEIQTEVPESIKMLEKTALLEIQYGCTMDDTRAQLSGTVTTLSTLLGWAKNLVNPTSWEGLCIRRKLSTSVYQQVVLWMANIGAKDGGCTRQSKSDGMCGMIVGRDAQLPRTSKLECLACMYGGLNLQWRWVGWQRWRRHCILARFLSLTLGCGGSRSRVLTKLAPEERRSTAYHGNPRSMKSTSAHTQRGTFGRIRTCGKRSVMKERSAWIW